MAPVSASRNVSSGGPPTVTHRTVGAWAWLMASRPHGNAYGHRARTASAATHQAATATGHTGSRSISRWPIASSAKMTASAPASAAQAYQARLISQDSSGTKNASPNTRADDERGAESAVPERDHEQGRAHRRERPERDRRERPGECEAARERDEQRREHAQAAGEIGPPGPLSTGPP